VGGVAGSGDNDKLRTGYRFPECFAPRHEGGVFLPPEDQGRRLYLSEPVRDRLPRAE
jgi:hypothetical protein